MRKKTESDTICKECGHITQYGKEECFCDVCKKKLLPKQFPLQISVFWNDIDSFGQDIDCCSWKCLAQWLKEFPLNKDEIRFITLPYIRSLEKEHFDDSLQRMLEAFKE